VLRHPTLDKLHTLKLTGMATALTEQREMPEVQRLSFEERLGLLVDRELTTQEHRRLVRRLAQARLRLNATLEDLDYRHPRGLDKGLLATLATGQWIRSHDHVLITGQRSSNNPQVWSLNSAHFLTEGGERWDLTVLEM